MSSEIDSVMGIDLGTQSVKVVIYNYAAREITHCVAHPLELISKPDGGREQLAQWWLDGLQSCLQKIDAPARKKIAAIGVSGQQHGFVPLDRNGQPLAPVKLWCDTATTAECDEIMRAVGGEQRCIDIAGNPIAVGYTASKIRWLKHHDSESYKCLATIVLPHDYLNFYLTGRYCMEFGDASGTGLLDVRRRCWSADMIAALDADRDLSPCLPELIDAHMPVGRIRPALAQAFGIPAAALVSAGGGDNMMAAIGTGNVTSGRLTASLGTSGTLFAYAQKPVVDGEGELAAFCSSTGGWLPLLCTMNCTVATEQLCQLFELDAAAIDLQAGSVGPGAGGVITLPFYHGERTPALPNGKAVIYGLDADNTTRAHMLRSAMEAAVFGLKRGMRAFERCGLTFNELTLTGGGSNSALWCQLCADILDLPISVFQQQENAALGAALQALWCYTRESDPTVSISDITAAHLRVDQCRYYRPEAEAVSAYADIYQRYKTLLNAVAPLYDELK